MTEADPLRPQEPRLLSSDLPAVGGRVAPSPEDFVVDEIPLVVPSGAGEHLWVRVRKRGHATPDALREVARAAGVRERDLGCAGMKDKHAVTSQWVSLPAACRPPGSWQLPEGLEVLEHARHSRKLRTGQLLGNRFGIRLVEVGEDALARARAICARLSERGLPNYFGMQRFGRGGENLQRAVSWLQQGAAARGRHARFFRKLYPSVIQSEVYNRTLTSRLEQHGLDTLLRGDVVRLDGSRAVFVVDDPAAELPRLHARDIHLTGPIPGPKMKPTEGEPARLEAAAVARLRLEPEAIERLGRLADGTRRDLRVFPDQLRVEPAPDGGLRLEFSLPAGSYATQLVRELTRSAWFAPCDPDP